MAKLYSKQLLKFGKWYHDKAPNGVLKITKKYVKGLIDNFKKSPFVAVTRGHLKKGEAEKNPELIITKNIKGLEMDKEGLNAKLMLSKKELNKYNDVSIEIDPNAEDHTTKEKIGNAIRKIAMVTDPYIKGLKPFVALKEDSYLINLSEIKAMKKVKKDKVDLEEETKEEETTKSKEEESKKAESEKSKASDEGIDGSEKGKSIKLQERIAELESKVAKQESEIALKEAETQYSKLLKVGKITPAQKDTFISLCTQSNSIIELSDGTKTDVQALVKELFKKAPKIIEFKEKGVDTEATEEESKLKVELRERHSEMNDKQYAKWYEKHKETIEGYAKA